MPEKIKFGTDGWRGVIAENYTFDSVRRCTQGFAGFCIQQGKGNEWVVVGYDKRFQSENFALAVAEVLAGNGIHVYLTNGATPTPVISYSVVAKKAAGAVNITASHNPPTDNGFKVRNEFGGAIDPEGLTLIESLIPEDMQRVKRMPAKEAVEKGFIVYFDPAPDYIQHIEELIDLQPIRDAGLNIWSIPLGSRRMAVSTPARAAKPKSTRFTKAATDIPGDETP